jgi:hypothetical protein
MFKRIPTCAALIAFTMNSVNAQQREAVLHKIEVPGAKFDIILAMPKSPETAIFNFGDTPDALVVHLIGGKLALSFDTVEKMLEALDSLRLPVCAFQVESSADKSRNPVAVYVVSKGSNRE